MKGPWARVQPHLYELRPASPSQPTTACVLRRAGGDDGAVIAEGALAIFQDFASTGARLVVWDGCATSQTLTGRPIATTHK